MNRDRDPQPRRRHDLCGSVGAGCSGDHPGLFGTALWESLAEEPTIVRRRETRREGGIVMMLAHKIALDPNDAQETYFRKAAGVARFAYHWA